MTGGNTLQPHGNFNTIREPPNVFEDRIGSPSAIPRRSRSLRSDLDTGTGAADDAMEDADDQEDDEKAKAYTYFDKMINNS